MRTLFTLIALAAVCLSEALAGPFAFSLAEKMSKSLSDAERNVCARWMVMTMAQHPAAKGLVSSTQIERENISKEFIELQTKILTERFREDARIVYQKEGERGISTLMFTFGRLSGGIVFDDGNVKVAIAETLRRADNQAIIRALKE
jgi:hypothetical protein